MGTYYIFIILSHIHTELHGAFLYLSCVQYNEICIVYLYLYSALSMTYYYVLSEFHMLLYMLVLCFSSFLYLNQNTRI